LHLSLSRAPATTEIYTLSLHDALPIFRARASRRLRVSITSPHCSHIYGQSDTNLAAGSCRSDTLNRPSGVPERPPQPFVEPFVEDRKSTRLNSSHVKISYAVFCLKKKK